MTESMSKQLETINVATADDLVTFWGLLMGGGGFARRTLWLAVLEDSGRPVPVIVPIEDVPRAPSGPEIKALKTVLASLVDYGNVVMLLSRPGRPGVLEDDRRWARMLHPLADRWPVHLATADGAGSSRVQPITA